MSTDNDSVSESLDTLAAAITTYISAGKARERFAAFSDAVGDRSKLMSLLRDVETERLLTGTAGPVLTISDVESVTATGAKPSELRDRLFFGVTAAISADQIALDG